jgi:hypothetical protein
VLALTRGGGLRRWLTDSSDSVQSSSHTTQHTTAGRHTYSKHKSLRVAGEMSRSAASAEGTKGAGPSCDKSAEPACCARRREKLQRWL